MATIVTVHGTFALTGGTAEALSIGAAMPPQWWQAGSDFEKHVRTLLEAETGELKFLAFSWNGLNSEMARREAGTSLLKLLRGLDAQGEPYVVIGHSHGGSVIAAALMESVGRGRPLSGLKKWVTVGTPFVDLTREKFLFSRLTLTRKVMFVASLMLLMMFAFYAVGGLFSDARPLRGSYHNMRLLVSGLLMSLPFVVFYVLLRYLDGRELFTYGRRAVRAAQENYAPKWLALSHKDDEAVQGLRYLPRVKLHLFDDGFATSALTKTAILVLPLAYLFAVTSPSLMTGLADFLKNTVYKVDELAAPNSPVAEAEEEFRNLRRAVRQSDQVAEQPSPDGAQNDSARARSQELRRQLRTKRRELEQKFPELDDAERAARFKRRFLERDGQACEGGTLCGGGRDFALNSELLFHVVTDELSNAIVNDDLGLGAWSGLARIIVPVVVVPVIFGLLALAVLAVIQYIARILSAWFSRWLNHLTLTELRRSALGNDTEGEVALGAGERPSWIATGYRPLPDELGERLSDYSNDITAQSLAKFRNAISTLAFAEQEGTKAGVISNYLSWKELIHTTYFDVPELRQLIARAISAVEGFRPAPAFKSDAAFEASAVWLANVQPKPSEEPDSVAQAAAQPAPTT